MPVPNTFVAGTDILASEMNANFNAVEMVSLVADEDLTAGQTVGISNYLPSGRVARALRKVVTAAMSFTPIENLTDRTMSCPIGGDKFVFGSAQTSDDSLYLTVGSINQSTKAVTLGTSLAATADISGRLYALCKLDTDKFIVFYVEDASTTIVKYRIGTVSGTTITFGTAATYFTGSSAVQQLAADYVSANKAIAVFKCSTTTHSRAVAMTASGTVATPGTALALEVGGMDANDTTLVKTIGTDKFVVATVSGTNGRVHCASMSGTTITFDAGGSIVWSATVGSSKSPFDIVSPTTDVVVISFINSSSSGLDVVALTASGTVLTAGSVLAGVFNATINNCGLYAESSTSILAFSSGANKVVKITRSGTTLTLTGDAIRTLQGSNSLDKFIAMDGGYYIIVRNGLSTSFEVYIQGMANNFFGIVQATVSRGATVLVQYSGKDSNQTGLMPGGYYMPNGTGGLTFIGTDQSTNNPDENFVQAISATQVIL